eukprot:1177059-Pyramimonas_sp.AAC.1
MKAPPFPASSVAPRPHSSPHLPPRAPVETAAGWRTGHRPMLGIREQCPSSYSGPPLDSDSCGECDFQRRFGTDVRTTPPCPASGGLGHGRGKRARDPGMAIPFCRAFLPLPLVCGGWTRFWGMPAHPLAAHSCLFPWCAGVLQGIARPNRMYAPGDLKGPVE